MSYWNTRLDWLDKLLPDGYPLLGATLVSGPGGSGKPLISLLFSAAWLDAGGRALFMQILRMRDAGFVPDEIKVPFDHQTLMRIKQAAELGRRDLIPAISKV